MVIGLYFFIKGFIRTKYKAYEQALISTNKLPKAELVPPDFCPYQTRRIAPMAPITIPIILFADIFSFNIKALKIKTITGIAVIIIEASIGDVKFNP